MFGGGGAEYISGMATRIASEAASEKLRTDVIDMTVDAKQRLSD